MLLKVGFDKNSANAEYQKLITELKKNKFEVKPDINYAKSKQEIGKQVADIAKIFKDGLNIDDKSANRYAKSYYNEVVKGIKSVQTEQSKQLLLANNIKATMSLGKLSTDFSKVSADYNGLSNKTNSLETSFQNLKQLKTQFENSGNNQQLVTNYEKYSSSLQAVQNQIKQINIANQALNKTDAFSRNKSSAISKINSFIKENSNLTQSSIEKLNNLATAMESAGNPNALKNLTNESNNLQRSLKAAGETGRNFGDEMKNNFKKFSTWVGASAIFFGVQRAIKGVVSNVIELDTAMTSLYKVTDETDAKYNSFLQNAYKSSQKLGQSVTNIVEQTAQWAKLGYGVDDAAKLAEISSVYSNVGEVDNQTAVKDIVTSMKAYGIASSEAIKIIDSYNKLGKFVAHICSNTYLASSYNG